MDLKKRGGGSLINQAKEKNKKEACVKDQTTDKARSYGARGGRGTTLSL